jgi:predicted nuclease of predicted toxin-antitoxin system
MRFLVDRCAGHKLAVWLREQGHDVAEVRDLGKDPGDRAILAIATSEQRVLVTIDKDFGQFMFLERSAHSGVISLADLPGTARISLMGEVLRAVKDHAWAQVVVTARTGRIRITHSPQ